MMATKGKKRKAPPAPRVKQKDMYAGAVKPVVIESLYPDTLARRPHLEYTLRGKGQTIAYTPDMELMHLPFRLTRVQDAA